MEKMKADMLDALAGMILQYHSTNGKVYDYGMQAAANAIKILKFYGLVEDDKLVYDFNKGKLREILENKMKTIICDIDGTLVYHSDSTSDMILLSGTIDKLIEWQKLGYNLILTTGRRESMRKVTEEQLATVGITYDQLVMGLGPGGRYLINDRKTGGMITAVAINLKRDEGISKVEI